MTTSTTSTICRALVLTFVFAGLAHAHHPMGYGTPATWMEGFLSGLGHPILGLDHLVFIVAAGVLASRLRGGLLLPLAFVVASNLAVAARAGGLAWDMSELWVAGSLVALAAVMMIPRQRILPVAVVFLGAGGLHGYALAEAIVGAETTPLHAYLLGLTLVQCAIAYGAAAGAAQMARRRPQLDLQRLAGATAGAAGLVFAGLALL